MIVGLALIAVPRAVLHDLDLVGEGTFMNLLLTFAPPVVWIVVALARRVSNPFLNLLAIGAWYGVFLAVTHQLMWDRVFAGGPPALGGNLTDLDPELQTIFFRIFTTASSFFTGLMVGAISGGAAWSLNRLRGREGQVTRPRF